MREADERMIFRNAVDRRLSGLQENPFLAQRIMNAEKGEIKVKKKLSVGLVFIIAILLIAAAALAVALLSPKEIMEQVAVPLAQNNTQENYTYKELKELITALNENGITLDEGSTLMQAFESGRGYWERDAIHEICLAAFGKDEGAWSIEQRHWYGEMMVAVGAWDRNDFLLPGEGDLTEQEARKLAVMALKDAYSIELPLESTKDWHVGIGFVSNYYEEGENSYWIVEWQINFSRPEKPNVLVYDVSFDRHGNNIQTDHHEEPEIDERALQRYAELMTNATKEQEAMKKYGEIMYFWPDEVKVEVYGATGLPYAIPEQAELEQAQEDTEGFIAEKYGSDALEKLGDYQVGYLFQRLENDEYNLTQLMWDIMLTTDPEYLSDGYRVQFQRVIHHETGEEEITDLIVERAHLGNG
ncbi:MAG: hypothetical protein IJI45_19605 [Anaerolineaceae bacterium]|nr:hypothetical protein [Anaerolineaceae bacterium]